MIRETLSRIDGAALFATIPLILFLVIFVGVIVWTTRLDKTLIHKWSQLPLEGNSTANEEREVRS